MDGPKQGRELVGVLQGEAARVLEVAESAGDDLTMAVVACPGWDFAQLLTHLGNVYNWVGTIVEQRPETRPSSDLPLRPEGMRAPDWMANRLGRLVPLLESTPEDALMWNFGPESPAPVSFWRRRQVHETAIHRVDAELAAGQPVTPFAPELAADGIAELLTLLRFNDTTDTAAADAGDIRPRDDNVPATIHLHATDVEGAEWTIDTSATAVTRRHSKADVAVRGSAWALDRWFWGRPVEGEIETFGDPVAAEAWRASVVF
jgi:uncharacterized protein (TIGR03083 family)